MSGWRGLVVRWMRVPPEPEPPPGIDARVFRASRNFFRYKLVAWGISQASALTGLLFALYFVGKLDFSLGPISRETVGTVLLGLEGLGWLGFIAQIPFSLAITFLDYEMRWYIVTDRSLRIREGIMTVKEKTMTFANIQNLTVRQGPLQRMLGIADVEVRNAGGGGSESGNEGNPFDLVHVGYFRGLANASEVRDSILAGVRKQRHAGLGDDDDEPEVVSAPTGRQTLAAAANELVAEARLLRSSFTP